MKLIKLLNGVLTEFLSLSVSTGAGDADKVVSTDGNGRLDASLMPGGAPVNTSAGAGDAGKLPKLDAGGKLAMSMMPSGLGADERSATASEAISAGDLVNFWNNGGTVNIRKADASSPAKQAHGFCSAAVAQGATGVVTLDGTISGLSGLTVGEQYLSGATPGAATATAPSTSGYIVQSVGFAVSATELAFEARCPITLA